MEMYALVRVNQDVGLISALFSGEYEMEFSNGKTAKFCFKDSNVVRQVGYDNRVLNIHLWNVNIGNPDSEFLKHFIGSITKIIKFPVMVTGIDYRLHIKPTALLDLKLYNNDLKYIDIDKNLLSSDVFKN